MSKICFVGSGNMAEAIIDGILDAKIYKPDEVIGSDVNRERLSYINLKFGIKTSLNKAEDLGMADIIVLSVKPQCIAEVMKDLSRSFKPDALIISILAGVSIGKLEAQLKEYTSGTPKIARVMPNMGAFVREAVSAICFSGNVSEEDRESAKKIFSSIGHVHLCDEEEINLITALSGSGPAYVFYFVEALTEAATRLGMERAKALDFCLETFQGAVKLLALRKSEPSELREKVTSKGGTTEAAIKVFESRKLKGLFQEALKAAFDRAIELGK